MQILFISYFFPPMGGPAVLRNTKIIKYLGRMGWDIDVLTINDAEYFFRDESLVNELNAQRIIRTRSLDPMSLIKMLRRGKASSQPSGLYLRTPERIKLLIRKLYPIDDKIGWLPFLIKSGMNQIVKRKYDLIYVSCGPFSSGVGACIISERSGIPLVYDARDYWTSLSDYDLEASPLHRRLSRYWEERIIRRAELIVCATEGIKRDLANKTGDETKCLTVYNGWDEEDFEGLEAGEEREFSLAYFGNIYARRSLKSFYRAVQRFKNEDLLPPKSIIRLYGVFTAEVKAEIEESGLAEMISLEGMLPHKEALQAMLDSSVLLLLVNSGSPEGTLTSKVFEYLRTGNPILAMIPPANEAAALLRSCGQDYICAMESSEAIYNCLKRLIGEYGQKERAYRIPQEYSREAQIGKLDQALKAMINCNG